MKKQFIYELLICPDCKSNLNKVDNSLICNKCNQKFDIINDAVIFKKLTPFQQKDTKHYFFESYLNKFHTFNRSLNLNKKFVEDLIDSFDENAKILNLGAGKQILRKNIVNIDIELFDNIDIVGDANNIPIKENSFDCVITQALLEHVSNPDTVVNEIYRILKNGGCIYAEIPFLQPYHPSPNDFQRYTIDGIRNLFNKFKEQTVGFCVGPTASLIGFLQEYIPLFFNFRILRGMIYYFLKYFLFPLRYLDLLLVNNKKAHIVASSVFFLGTKT